MLLADDLKNGVFCYCITCNEIWIALALLLLFALCIIILSHNLPACRWLELSSYSRSMKGSKADDTILSQSAETSRFEANQIRNNARIRDYAEREKRLKSELLELQAARQTAARDLEQKDSELKAVKTHYLKLIEPSHRFPEDMHIAVAAKLAAAYRKKRESKLEKREASVESGKINQELQIAKKHFEASLRAKDDEYEERLACKTRDLRTDLQDRKADIKKLSDEADMHEYRIGAFKTHVTTLITAESKLQKMLSKSNEALNQERAVCAGVQEAVLEKDGELLRASNAAFVTGIQLREANVSLSIESGKLEKARARVEALEGDLQDGKVLLDVEELNTRNLSKQLGDVRLQYRRMEVEMQKQKTMFEGKLEIKTRGIRGDIQHRSSTNHTEQQSQCNRIKELRAVEEREARLKERVGAMSIEVDSLKKQLVTANNALQAANTQQFQPGHGHSQVLCGHKEQLQAAADRETALVGSLDRAKSELTALNTQPTAEFDALRTFKKQATTLRDYCARELKANNPAQIRLDQCIDQYRKLLREANRSVATKQLELQKLEASAKSHREELQKKGAELTNAKNDTQTKEKELRGTRTKLTESEKVVRTQAAKLGTSAYMQAGLHVTKYVAQQGFKLQVIAAVERDVFRVKALAQEYATIKTDTNSSRVLDALIKCNSDIDHLRSVQQNIDARPSRLILRHMIANSYVEQKDISNLTQAVPYLRKQVLKANALISRLLDSLDTEAATAFGKALDQSRNEDEDEVNERIADQPPIERLREVLLSKLLAERNDES